jgi:hypothetical protein
MSTSPIIYVRDTVNWKEKRITKFQNGSVPSMIRTWDNVFTMSYWDYRDHLKSIALSSWEEASSRIQIMDFKNFEYEDDDYILPTDDDDWVNPSIDIGSDKDVVVWGSIVHKTYVHHKYTYWPTSRGCCSNNYAIRGSFLRKLPHKQKIKILKHHMSVLKIAGRNGGTVENMSKVHSCYNWHPGSASLAKWPPHLPRKIPTNYRDTNDAVISRQNPWIKPYVRKFVHVLKQVNLKKIML